MPFGNRTSSWREDGDWHPRKKRTLKQVNQRDFISMRPYRISVVELTRIVRFHFDGSPRPIGSNGYAGRPSISGLAPMVEVQITLRGEPDPKSHYVLDIKLFDRWANEHVFPAFTNPPGTSSIEDVFRRAFAGGDVLPHELIAITLKLTPFASLTLEKSMSDTRPTLTYSQSYDFAAAHYLWAHEADEERNRELYGKCSGIHGHNYQVEVVVEPEAQNPIPSGLLDQVVNEHLLDAWDHRVLNDLEDFQDVPPSVERIAQKAADRLAAPLAACSLKLREVSVSETDRTRARVRLG